MDKRFEVALPEEVLAHFGWKEAETPRKLRELVIMELLRHDRLSEAEAANLLQIDRWELLELMERQAIVLAGELRASILIDEKRGWAVARERGLMVLGSLWILAEAKWLGIIEQAKPLLDAMLAAAYRIDEDLVPPFLQEVGKNISL